MKIAIQWTNKQQTQQRIETALKKKLNTFSGEVLKEIDKKTPVDTGLLKKNNLRTPIKKVNSRLVQILYNPTPYAKYVEYGRTKKRKANNYWNTRRTGNIIHTGIGARMYERTKKELKTKK